MKSPNWAAFAFAAALCTPQAAWSAPPTWAYTLLDASQATAQGGAVLFATQPKVVGDQASVDLMMVFVVPAPDPSVGNAIVSHVDMPLTFACSTRMATQMKPTVFDTAGQVVNIPQDAQWPQEGPVPVPEAGTVEPAFEAFRLACGQRVVTKTFPTLAAIIAFARNATNAPLLAPP